MNVERKRRPDMLDAIRHRLAGSHKGARRRALRQATNPLTQAGRRKQVAAELCAKLRAREAQHLAAREAQG